MTLKQGAETVKITMSYILQTTQNKFIRALAKHICGEIKGASQCCLVFVHNFTFTCYLHLWCTVFGEANAAQLYLQTKGVSLDKVAAELEALMVFLKEECSHLVDDIIKQGLVKSSKLRIAAEGHIKVKRRTPRKQAKDTRKIRGWCWSTLFSYSAQHQIKQGPRNSVLVQTTWSKKPSFCNSGEAQHLHT